MDIHNLTAKDRKKLHTWLRALIQLLYFLFIPSVYTAAFAGVKYIFTQIGAGEKIAMTSFMTVLLVICLYTMVFGRFFCGFACAFGAFGDALHALYTKACKKMKRETGEDPGKGSRDFKLYEIFGTVADCSFVLCWCIWKSAGNQPVGCIFHDPCRQFPSGRLCDRSCDPASSDGGHVCTGKIFLPVLLPDGSSIFPASGTAVFLPSQNERKLQKRM